jgi:hypothetical protein
MIYPNWVFKDVAHMCLFFKALHAYDVTLEEIERDVRNELGVLETSTGIAVPWPLLLFDLRKR